MWHDHGLSAKRAPYGPSVRIPFLFRYDGGHLATADPEDIVANIDIAPTVMEAAGVSQDPDRPMDGRSLLSGPNRTRLLLEYFVEFGVPTWASTVTDEMQYVEYYRNNGTTITFKEFYRLENDPYQLSNVLKDGKGSNDPSNGEKSAMHQQLAEDRECRGANCP